MYNLVIIVNILLHFKFAKILDFTYPVYKNAYENGTKCFTASHKNKNK